MFSGEPLCHYLMNGILLLGQIKAKQRLLLPLMVWKQHARIPLNPLCVQANYLVFKKGLHLTRYQLVS